MLILDGYKQIKQFKSQLRVIHFLLRNGYSREDVREQFLEFDTDLPSLIMKHKDFFIMRKNGIETESGLILNTDDDGEYLSNSDVLNELWHERVTVEGIKNLMDLIDKLELYKVDFACLGESEEIPHDVLNSLKVSNLCIDTDNIRNIQVRKVYSDSEITYKLDKPINNPPRTDYKCYFSTQPKWVLAGHIVYQSDGSLYLGNENPRTYFNFYSSSIFNLDTEKIPSFEELYEKDECLSLKLCKNR